MSITQARLKELLEYDPETGVFTRLTTVSQAKAGSAAGSLSAGYLAVRLDGKLYYCHRLAWLYMTGQWPRQHVDHINGRRTDNRWSNLRDVARRTNQQNMRHAFASNTTGLLGVSKNHKRFMANIGVPGGTRYLGTFDTPEEAHAAYLAAKRQFHEGCTI